MCCRTVLRILVLSLASLILACGVQADSLLESAVIRSSAGLVGAETPIDPTIYPIPQPIDDEAPKVIFDGTNFFVVWSGAGSEGIYGARLSASGAPLDPVAIRIGPGWVGATAIDVAFNGKAYLVVWTDLANRVNCARVSAAGDVLDSKPVVVTENTAFGPAVSSDGRDFLLVWSELVDGVQSLSAARVGADGTVIDPGGVSLGAEGLDGTDAEIGFDGAGFMVAFTKAAASVGVWGLRVGPDGTAVGTAFPISGPLGDKGQSPEIAFAAPWDSYLVVWQAGNAVYGRRVRSDGAVLGTSESMLSPGAKAWWPRVAFGTASSGWTVTWAGDPDLYSVRVDAQGAVVGAPQVKVSAGDVGMPAVASNGSECLVVWYELNGSWDIFGKRISVDGNVLDSQPRLVSMTNNRQRTPAVAFDGTNHLVLWADDRNGTELRAARVGATGEVLDKVPIEVTSTPEPESAPDVAFNGTDYLAVWTRSAPPSAEIRAARISTAGVVKDPSGILISASSNQGSPTVAALGSGFLVAWVGQAGESSDILGKRVAADGSLLDGGPIMIGTGPNEQTAPSASSDGKNYFVVWEEARPGWDVVGARVTADGLVIDPIPLGIGVHPYRSERDPDIAFDGSRYGVVWRDEPEFKIQGAYVSTEGLVQTSFGVSGEEAAHPAIAFDGTGFFTVWKQSEHGAPSEIMASAEGYVGRLTSDDLQDTMPALASSGAGWLLVAYEKAFDSSKFRGSRIVFQVLRQSGPGGECQTGLDCATGFCVEGVCCLTACLGNCLACEKGTGVCSAASCPDSAEDAVVVQDGSVVAEAADTEVMVKDEGPDGLDGAEAERQSPGAEDDFAASPEAAVESGAESALPGMAPAGQEGCACRAADRTSESGWLMALSVMLPMAVRRARGRGGQREV